MLVPDGTFTDPRKQKSRNLMFMYVGPLRFKVDVPKNVLLTKFNPVFEYMPWCVSSAVGKHLEQRGHCTLYRLVCPSTSNTIACSKHEN